MWTRRLSAVALGCLVVSAFAVKVIAMQYGTPTTLNVAFVIAAGTVIAGLMVWIGRRSA